MDAIIATNAHEALLLCYADAAHNENLQMEVSHRSLHK